MSRMVVPMAAMLRICEKGQEVRMMTPEEISKLEEAAKKATPGPWTCNFTSVTIPYRPTSLLETVICSCIAENKCQTVPVNPNPHNDCAYIAAANPQAILSLIASHRKALEELDVAKETLECVSLEILQHDDQWLLNRLLLDSKLAKAKAALELIAGPSEFNCAIGEANQRSAARAALKEIECQE